jgi:hypothetical protein
LGFCSLEHPPGGGGMYADGYKISLFFNYLSPWTVDLLMVVGLQQPTCVENIILILFSIIIIIIIIMMVIVAVVVGQKSNQTFQ